MQWGMIPHFECAVCGYFTLGSGAGADCKGQNLKAVTVVPASVVRPLSDHSGLSPANFTTLAHFSVSSAMNFPKSAGEPGNAVPPRSARRALNLGSVRAALISLLSLSMISAGVSFGTPTPCHELAS